MTGRPKKRPYITRCILLTDSLPAAILMYRLMVWKPTRMIDGRWWFAKSHEDLLDETGLTPKQLRTALATLREKGFIKTSQHIFRGKNLNHYLVTAEFVQAFESVALQAQTGQPE